MRFWRLTKDRTVLRAHFSNSRACGPTMPRGGAPPTNRASAHSRKSFAAKGRSSSRRKREFLAHALVTMVMSQLDLVYVYRGPDRAAAKPVRETVAQNLVTLWLRMGGRTCRMSFARKPRESYKNAISRPKPGTQRRRQGRSERTRQKIKEAVIGLLNEQNYFDLTITEICQSAGIATGGFYFHYEKKADLIDEVLREHNAHFWSVLMAALDYRDPFSAVYHASAALVHAFHDSPGLVRCFNQLAMIDKSYVRLWESAATNWAAQLADMLAASGEMRDGGHRKANVYGLLSFADLLLFGLYIERDPALVAAAGPADEVIQNLAVLWFRALTGHSPPAARLAYANRGLGI